MSSDAAICVLSQIHDSPPKVGVDSHGIGDIVVKADLCVFLWHSLCMSGGQFHAAAGEH